MDTIRKLSVARQGSVKDTNADAELAQMGYKSELPRNLSMLSVLGLYASPTQSLYCFILSYFNSRLCSVGSRGRSPRLSLLVQRRS